MFRSVDEPAHVVRRLVERVARARGRPARRSRTDGSAAAAASARSRAPSARCCRSRTCPLVDDGTVSLPIAATSRRWLSSTRIFTGYCSPPSRKRRDLVVARHHQPQGAADVRDAHAEIRGAGPVHRDVHFGAGVAEVGLGVHQARQLLRAQQQLLRVVVQLGHVRALQAGLDGEVAVAAAERVLARLMAGASPGCRASTWRTRVITSSCETSRSSARLQVEKDVEVVARGRRRPDR